MSDTVFWGTKWSGMLENLAQILLCSLQLGMPGHNFPSLHHCLWMKPVMVFSKFVLLKKKKKGNTLLKYCPYLFFVLQINIWQRISRAQCVGWRDSTAVVTCLAAPLDWLSTLLLIMIKSLRFTSIHTFQIELLSSINNWIFSTVQHENEP